MQLSDALVCAHSAGSSGHRHQCHGANDSSDDVPPPGNCLHVGAGRRSAAAAGSAMVSEHARSPFLHYACCTQQSRVCDAASGASQVQMCGIKLSSRTGRSSTARHCCGEAAPVHICSSTSHPARCQQRAASGPARCAPLWIAAPAAAACPLPRCCLLLAALPAVFR